MNGTKSPFKKYPGNSWFIRQVELFGSESTIPFIHGVVRGTLANPYAADPGAALETVLYDGDNEDYPQDDFDKLSIAFLFLYNDTARALTSSCPLPEALSSDFRTEAGWLYLLSEAAELAAGFVRGFNLKELPGNKDFTRTLACLRNLANEGEWCRMMFEDPRLLEKSFPRGCFLEDVISEAAGWVEEYTRKVAVLARVEAKEQRTEELGKGLED